MRISRAASLLWAPSLVLAVLPLGAACTADASRAAPATPTSSAPEASSSPGQDSVKSPSESSESPELDDAETVAGRQGVTRGGGSFEFSAGEKGDTLVIAVRCQREGKVKLSVQPVNVAFPLNCVDGEPNTTYNEVDVAGVEKKGTVSVLGPSSVRWSMTVGRGEPTEGEPAEAEAPERA
ncbi:hypothetical protein [Streptomyces tauricus]|uniref:hypothetical protein n=1 Tax=Streptomyces tauricus TaxID=68274 RepID=UPI002244A160|nr:hypothetical protein [Streptomyces tauricus]MCW8100375.1 hypothetical protein [Streptomyces tauricus]